VQRKALTVFLFLTLFSFFAQGQKENIDSTTKEIIIVFKTHFDIGYTDYAEAVAQKYSTSMIQGALDIQEQTKLLPKENQFVWTLPGWPMMQILNKCTPELKPRIEAAIKKGYFAVHALPYTMETESGDVENLARSFIFSSTISRNLGLPLPVDAKMTDVPSHSWFIPTLLTSAGVKILHLGCNPASQSPKVPLLFWWEGPDASRLMTMYWGGDYGTSLIPPEEWKYKTWLAIIHTTDNHGAPTTEEVAEVLKNAHRLAPNAKIRIGRISDFYYSMIKENADIPVVRGDMPDSWIHGFMSMPREEKSSRALSNDMFSLESLNTLLNIWNNKRDTRTSTISKASENLLLFYEHTFGMAISHGHSGYWCYGDEFNIQRANGAFNRIEGSWKEKGDRVAQVEKTIIPAYQIKIQQLADAVKTEGQRVVVYNPLAWKRNGIVTIHASSWSYPIKALKDSETGELVQVENMGNIIRFLATDVPPLGYRTYIPVSESTTDKETSLKLNSVEGKIENEFFNIKIDSIHGAIASITNKKTGQSWINNKTVYGFGQYLYERFSKENTDKYANDYIKNKENTWNWAYQELGRVNLTNEPYHAVNGGKAKVIFSKDKVSVSASMLFKADSIIPQDYLLSINLYHGSPNIELIWSINGKIADSWPEAGWISFPFNIPNPSFKLGRLGGITDPSTDFVEGSNFDYCFLNTGMAILDKQNNGMGICSPDAPGISLGEPGLWKYTGKYAPKEANVFFNLYNNQWSTNFTEWIEGSWSARFYLWDISNFNNLNDIIIPSKEIMAPLVAAISSTKTGTLPGNNAGVSVSMKGVWITAFGPNPDGEGTLLRLWEQSGEHGKCKIELPANSSFTTAIPCDLRGQAVQEVIKIQDHQFSADVRAYQPLSFILK
jgi:alpha-mannosidase